MHNINQLYHLDEPQADFLHYLPIDRIEEFMLAEMNNKSILITGATGFIGSHLIRHLSSADARLSLFVLDFERNSFPTGSMIYHGNLANYQDCLRIVGRVNPEIVFHLAAQPLVDTAIDSVIDTMESNIRGAYNLLEACRNVGKKIKAIVWISTDKVYGHQHTALKEDTPLTGINHPYDASKLCGDILAQTYATALGLPIIIVRSGNVYGEWDLHWDRLIPGTIRSVLSGLSPEIRSDGKNKRDYLYVSDIIRAYLAAASGLITGKLISGSAINFGSLKSYTVLEVVSKILTVLQRTDLEPIIKNIARNEIPEQHIDFELAKNILDWSPKVNFDDGIQKTSIWYKEYFERVKENGIQTFKT